MCTWLQPYVRQAELQDADGRGVPSAARLQRAMLLATPALGAEQLLGVEAQREGASDPRQPNPNPNPTPSPNPNPKPKPKPKPNPQPQP